VLVAESYRVCIGGEWADGGAGTYEIVNPATEQVVAHAPQASVEQSLAATQAASEAFESWSRTTPEYRASLLEAAADLLDARLDEFIPIVQAETGATMRVAKTLQVPQAGARFRRYARGALEPTIDPLPPAVMPNTPLAPGGLISAVARRAPVGVVSCITSYNFPMTNMAGKIGPGARHGQHRRRQAGAAGPARRHQARRDSCTTPGSRPASSTSPAAPTSRRPRRS
jgi:phenylacetaldehyde dehydrogenase